MMHLIRGDCNPGWGSRVDDGRFICFAGNELVAIIRIRVGRRIANPALVADGYHARSDGLTSLAVVVATIGALVGWQLLDPIVDLVISGMILWLLKSAAKPVRLHLLDGMVPETTEWCARRRPRYPGGCGRLRHLISLVRPRVVHRVERLGDRRSRGCGRTSDHRRCSARVA